LPPSCTSRRASASPYDDAAMSFLHEKAALRRLVDFGGDENRLTP
jgi:hypothetical protein